MKLKLSFKRGSSTCSVTILVHHTSFKAFLLYDLKDSLDLSDVRKLLEKGYYLYGVREIL